MTEQDLLYVHLFRVSLPPPPASAASLTPTFPFPAVWSPVPITHPQQVQQVMADGMMAGAMQGAQAALGNVGLRNALFSVFGGDQAQQGGASNNNNAGSGNV